MSFLILSQDKNNFTKEEVYENPELKKQVEDKIEELESVLQSISAMRSRLEEGLTVLEQAISNSVST